ncbi:bifunctional hydroxymethylpyrimidine kinase/phosphomethylpyrimidine kinase [Leptospira ilyithenensis]|uniref:hydroxymethylpyrimidine kinase n=1 Tax=Leptospira ilyithenensis TaxID=2484901 RepID=A0A4R9LJ29_9LEPT|nr:bifunctional hydroxymethylpyrimidine kinase/phosphomethylpyrimidine kinase [Leptospira ilyithenensis]TGN06876.1 bifunctional hydroxymethylpyrimidine kinase/phosphomethylpyrimidine kinase [Leptospira ilyithenensis]
MKNFPITLSIAGSDSGGGAGVQADLKTFSSLGTFGTTAFTCLTAQNPDGVTAIHEIPTSFIKAQLDAVLSYFPVSACKTGMLFSEEIINIVREVLQTKPDIKLVVDPVMIATSGAKLLKNDAITALRENLIPIATIITPNLDEASLLLGQNITGQNELESSAKQLFDIFKVPILLKGGHLQNVTEAIDILFDGKSIYNFKKPFLKVKNTHGTGCTFSSAITSYLAHGLSLPEAVGHAKEYIHNAIEDSIQTGPTTHLNHFPEG